MTLKNVLIFLRKPIHHTPIVLFVEVEHAPDIILRL